MNGIIRLTWRYLSFHRLRSSILLVCLALTFLLPLYLHLLIRSYESGLTERARLTPLILGPRGNQFELVLRALYFTRSDEDETGISVAHQEALLAEDRSTVIPLHLGYTAQDFALVGTSLDYFSYRNLELAEGTLPLILGDAVIGHQVAARLNLTPGDSLLTDQTSLYNIAAEQPLRLRVRGVLQPQDTPDDQAVLVDVKTAWVIAGLGHGHDDLDTPENESQILSRDEDGALVGSAAVPHYREITPENLHTFHFHGEPADLPLSALIVLPYTDKDATILKARYQLEKTVQLVVPELIIDDLLAIVFQVKRFFDASFALVLFMTSLFLALVMILTWKLRQRERETLVRIGCSRLIVVWLQTAELGFLLLGGLLTAALLAFLLFSLTRQLHFLPL